MEKEASRKLRELFRLYGFGIKKEYILEKLDADIENDAQEGQVCGYDLVANMTKGQLIENIDNLWKKFEKARECKGYFLQMEMDESKYYVNGLEFKIILLKKAKTTNKLG
jgi:hypothetical protein